MTGREQYVWLCACGCGQPTLLAPRTQSRQGWIKGQPQAWLHGHANRRGTRYTVNPETGCWEWTSYINAQGYGSLWLNGRTSLAHRVMWEEANGPIPEGLVLDHLCRVRHCVFVGHLEPVTPLENIRRGESVMARAMRTGRCIRDHEFNDENTHIATTGQRVCRACERARYHEKKAQAVA